MGEPINKFSFFASFYEAAQDLDDEKRLAFYDAITSYAFAGKEPDFEGVMSTIWKLAKPNIDSSVNGQRTGGKGGRPKKGNPPSKPPVKTTPETDKDMDRDREKDRDMEMDALEIDPLDQSISNASASVGAAAAEAAPPPRCPDCGGPMWFDVKGGSWRCQDSSCGSAMEPKKPLCPLCGVRMAKNAQSGRWECPNCFDSFEAGAVVWP